MEEIIVGGLVRHSFFVIFEPGAYPVKLSIMSGEKTEKERKEEHPLEYERLKAYGIIVDSEKGNRK